MPELPDLEAYTKNLERMTSAKEVADVIIYKPDQVKAKREDMKELTSAKIRSFKRNGKETMIEFSNGSILSIHLMLRGRFDLVPDVDDVDYKMLALDLGDVYLVVSDPRGWAKVELNPPDPEVPDAFAPDFSLEYFSKKLKEKKSKNIKAFLVDQEIVRGIGNAYADEILWEAKVSPESKSGNLPDEVAGSLYEATLEVLKRSVDEILESDPDVINGEVRHFMRVHNKTRKTSPSGHKIKTRKLASRKTYYTDEQVVY